MQDQGQVIPRYLIEFLGLCSIYSIIESHLGLVNASLQSKYS